MPLINHCDMWYEIFSQKKEISEMTAFVEETLEARGLDSSKWLYPIMVQYILAKAKDASD